MKTKQQFFNLYHHDFVRVAVATPEVQVAQPSVNATRTIALMKAAAKESACLVVFPELGLTGYSCDDLFHQEALLSAAQEALGAVVHASGSIPVTAVVGVPLRHQSHLYNCAAVISGGVILGIVPKTYLPNYREYYEVRHLPPATHCWTLNYTCPASALSLLARICSLKRAINRSLSWP